MIEITDEHVELFGRVWHETPAGEPGARRRAGLTAVAEAIHAEQVAPIEAALAESENDVAELGRRLHAATSTLAELKQAQQ